MFYSDSKFRFYQQVLALLLLAPFIISCEKFEYSPYEVRLSEEEKDLNRKNVERIKDLPIAATDTLTFALISDTQGFYDETTALVNTINNMPEVDFVLHAGDITDYGLLKEYKLMHEHLKKLHVPFVTVIGNHDCLANGKKIYTEMYGPYNHSFIRNGIKFIFLNTNSLEFNFNNVPDLDWLEKELADTANYQQALVLTHVPPYSGEFDDSKEQPYRQLVSRYNVGLSMHGHDHSFSARHYYGDNILYLSVSTAGKKSFVLLKVKGRHVSFEEVKFSL